MRHNRVTKRLGRNFAERKALLENLVASVLRYQQIQTTVQKAKAAKRLCDRVISLGKRDTLAARRRAYSYLQDHDLTSKLFTEVAPRFKSRSGGYTRVLQLGYRKGDHAQMAILELTEKEIKVKEPKEKKKKAEKAPKEAMPPHVHHKPHEEPKAAKPEAEKKEKPKKGFFQNIGRFFRNKGGG